ncbi:MAG: hypothetical protein H7834_04290, partial [Magnetococcus sp. YQC-9]
MFAWRSPFGFVVESVNSNIPNQKAERLLFRLVAAMPRYAERLMSATRFGNFQTVKAGTAGRSTNAPPV